MTKTKKMIITGLMIAVAIILPIVFHMLAFAGKIFLPMHIPVFICGLICGPIYGLICGILSPLMSHFLTGMPPTVVLSGMIFELAVYGFSSGLLIGIIRTKNKMINVYSSLIISMLLGRITYGILNGFVFMAGKYSFKAFIMGAFVTGLPGIIIQLIFIPFLLYALERRKLIDIGKEQTIVNKS